jgi:hypothetical protein
MNAAQPSAQPGLQPTGELVHGAFTDASWRDLRGLTYPQLLVPEET